LAVRSQRQDRKEQSVGTVGDIMVGLQVRLSMALPFENDWLLVE